MIIFWAKWLKSCTKLWYLLGQLLQTLTCLHCKSVFAFPSGSRPKIPNYLVRGTRSEHTTYYNTSIPVKVHIAYSKTELQGTRTRKSIHTHDLKNGYLKINPITHIYIMVYIRNLPLAGQWGREIEVEATCWRGTNFDPLYVSIYLCTQTRSSTTLHV